MAQQPGKLRWKESCWYGLSASQFGMALGFSGRVCDFVDYLRNVVGTEQEFTGNAFTNHGIVTEPKARALYEMLTGAEVHDGGFFLAHGRLLGCSPDGQIYYHEDTVVCPASAPVDTPYAPSFLPASSPASPTLSENAPWRVPRSPQRAESPESLTTRLVPSSSHSVPSAASWRATTQCAVRIPFSKKRSRSSGTLAQQSVRTSVSLDTGSPLCARLDGPKTSGFTAAAAAQTSGETVTIRTRRRRLLEIKSPFRALYDSKKKACQPFGIPLHYMCQMQGQMAIADAEECDFFVYLDQPCQVEAWRVKRSRAFWAWAEPKLLSVVAWTRDGPPDWLDRTFAFEPFDFSTLSVEPLVFPFDISTAEPMLDAQRFRFFAQYESPYSPPLRDGLGNDAHGCATEEHRDVGKPCPPDALLTAKAVVCDAVRYLFCDAVAAQSYSLDSLADALLLKEGGEEVSSVAKVESPTVCGSQFVANDRAALFLRELHETAGWNALLTEKGGAPQAPIVVMSEEAVLHAGTVHDMYRHVTLRVPSNWEMASIPVLLSEARGVTVGCQLGDTAVDACELKCTTVRCFHQAFFAGLRKQLAATSPSAAPHTTEDEVLMGTAPTTPVRSQSERSDNDRRLRDGLLQQTPVRDVVNSGESVSQHIRLSLTPVNTAKGDCSLTAHLREPKIIAEDDLIDLLRYAEDCSDLWLLVDHAHPGHEPSSLRHYARPLDVDRGDVSSLFTLVVGVGETLRRLVEHALDTPTSHELPHSAQVVPLRRLLRKACALDDVCPEISTVPPDTGVVLCYVEDSQLKAEEGVFPPLPCFVVHSVNASDLIARCESAGAEWE